MNHCKSTQIKIEVASVGIQTNLTALNIEDLLIQGYFFNLKTKSNYFSRCSLFENKPFPFVNEKTVNEKYIAFSHENSFYEDKKFIGFDDLIQKPLKVNKSFSDSFCKLNAKSFSHNSLQKPKLNCYLKPKNSQNSNQKKRKCNQKNEISSKIKLKRPKLDISTNNCFSLSSLPNFSKSNSLRRGKLKEYKHIKNNIYQDGKPLLKHYDAPQCNCDPHKESDVNRQSKKGCSDNCLNKMIYTECNSSLCKWGDKCDNQKIQKHRSFKHLNKFTTSDGRGYGIMTTQEIPMGEFISEYVGEVVTEEAFKDRMRDEYQHQTHHYCLNLHGNLVIDGYRYGNLMRFVNHSCDPNCEMQKWNVNGEYRIGLFSKRCISKTEELTYDYNFRSYNINSQQACKCGSRNCRGVVGGRHKPSQTSFANHMKDSPVCLPFIFFNMKFHRKNWVTKQAYNGFPCYKEKKIIAKKRIFLMRNLKSIVTYLHSKLLNETLESSQNKSLSFVNSSYNAVLFDINNNKNTNINKNFNNNNNRMKFNHHQKSVDLKKINFNNLLISKLNKFNNSASKRDAFKIQFTALNTKRSVRTRMLSYVESTSADEVDKLTCLAQVFKQIHGALKADAEKLRQEFAGISQLLTSKKSMSKSKDHCVASNQSAGKNDARLCGEAKVLCASVKSNKKQLLLNACAVDDNCITFKCIDKKISSGFYTKTASFHRDITKLIAYADKLKLPAKCVGSLHSSYQRHFHYASSFIESLGETLPICSINSTSQKGFHNERDNELEAKKNNFEVDCPSNRDVENNYSMTVFQKSTDFSNIIEENKNEEKCIEYFENHTEPVLVFEEDDEDAGRDERIECLCNMYDDVGVMLMCDACKTWQHKLCMGLFEDENKNVDDNANMSENNDEDTNKSNADDKNYNKATRAYLCHSCGDKKLSKEIKLFKNSVKVGNKKQTSKSNECHSSRMKRDDDDSNTYYLTLERVDGFLVGVSEIFYVLDQADMQFKIRSMLNEGFINNDGDMGDDGCAINERRCTINKEDNKEHRSTLNHSIGLNKITSSGNYCDFPRVSTAEYRNFYDCLMQEPSKLNIFKVDRLWIDQKGERMMSGHYFLRPYEVFHERNRKFFKQELLKAPSVQASLPMWCCVGAACVMDVNSYFLGRPRSFVGREEHVYVCEFKVTSNFRTVKKALKYNRPTNKTPSYFRKFKEKITFKRFYTPHLKQRKSFKKEGKKVLPKVNSVSKKK